MGLETGTYIADLNTSNPVFNDPETQGDDHLRLIKNVLQNTFPGANRAFPIPSSVTKSSNYTILSTDQNKIINVNTAGGAVTLTLPILSTGDYGWQATIMKNTTDVNPIFIVPGSGTLASGELFAITKCRRAIPLKPFRIIWSEGVWVVERCVGAPLGSAIPFIGSTLPVGYEWPNGQTLASASTNYPEYNSVVGSGLTPDWRQRIVAGSSLGGVDPTRITTAGSGIDGTTVGSAGGAQTVTLAQANLPSYNLSLASVTWTFGTGSGTVNSGTVSLTDPGHAHLLAGGTGLTGAASSAASGASPVGSTGANTTQTDTTTTGITASLASTALTVTSLTGSIGGTLPSGGSGTAVNKMPPTIITNWALVVE